MNNKNGENYGSSINFDERDNGGVDILTEMPSFEEHMAKSQQPAESANKNNFNNSSENKKIVEKVKSCHEDIDEYDLYGGETLQITALLPYYYKDSPKLSREFMEVTDAIYDSQSVLDVKEKLQEHIHKSKYDHDIASELLQSDKTGLTIMEELAINSYATKNEASGDNPYYSGMKDWKNGAFIFSNADFEENPDLVVKAEFDDPDQLDLTYEEKRDAKTALMFANYLVCFTEKIHDEEYDLPAEKVEEMESRRNYLFDMLNQLSYEYQQKPGSTEAILKEKRDKAMQEFESSARLSVFPPDYNALFNLRTSQELYNGFMDTKQSIERYEKDLAAGKAILEQEF